ncbi:MAG: zinc ribbon domain-containing protein [Bulleidia sp.]
MMKCTQCGTDNVSTAHYCHACGHAFSDADRQSAYEKTVFGLLDRLEDLMSWIDLSKITGNIVFRISVIVIMAALVFINVTRKGTHLTIADSEEYAVTYHSENNEYYVTTDLDTIRLVTYLPKETETLTIQKVQNGRIREIIETTPDQPLHLNALSDGYYTLQAYYTDDTDEQMTFFVCQEDDHV